MKKTIKLGLKKNTVQNLSNQEQQKVRGGIYTVEYHPCDTHEPEGCIPHTMWRCSVLYC